MFTVRKNATRQTKIVQTFLFVSCYFFFFLFFSAKQLDCNGVFLIRLKLNGCFKWIFSSVSQFLLLSQFYSHCAQQNHIELCLERSFVYLEWKCYRRQIWLFYQLIVSMHLLDAIWSSFRSRHMKTRFNFKPRSLLLINGIFKLSRSLILQSQFTLFHLVWIIISIKVSVSLLVLSKHWSYS